MACSSWARAASSCWRAMETPARPLSTSAWEEDSWLPVFAVVMGTLTCMDSAVAKASW